MTPDDPRLTAHALGEGSGDLTPEERAEVEALRAAAEVLRAGLASEPVPSLDPAHRGAIEGALRGLSPPAEDSRHHDPSRPGEGLSPPLPPLALKEHAGLGVLAASLLLVVGFAVAGATGGVEIGAQADDLAWLRRHQNPGAAELVVENVALDSLHDVKYITDGIGEFGEFKVPEKNLRFGGLGYVGGGGSAPADPGTAVRAMRGNGPARLPVLADAPSSYNIRAVTIPPSVQVLVTGTLPHSLLGLADGDFRGRQENIFVRLPDQDGTLGDAVTHGLDDGPSTEAYAALVENPWIRPLGDAALSTFSIDVDSAGYSIVRRCLVEQNRLPPKGAARLEEMVNYFRYDYAPPAGSDPLFVQVDGASCPWAPEHRLVRIAMKAREVGENERPAANLVFLLDVSGSMDQPNKLPLVKQSIGMLADRLTARDRVAIVVYAGASGLVLPSTAGDQRGAVQAALEGLGAGGSTNGGAGIELAYRVAAENFIPGGINRVILATDGDFNVGVTDQSSLVDLVKEKAKTKVFLTALGYGMDNLKDTTLEALADRGNGNYGYIDNLNEARRVLVEGMMSTLQVVAKDVKLQVEFNPSQVAAYRLLGYENRLMAAQDFADDTKDAGEVGAGHTVTALYEVVPAGGAVPGAPVDDLKYQRAGGGLGSAESLTVKLRWKEPEGDVSTAREFPFTDGGLAFDAAPEDFRFAAAVASFAQILRGSEHRGNATLPGVREIAASALGRDEGGYRGEFLTLVDRAAALAK